MNYYSTRTAPEILSNMSTKKNTQGPSGSKGKDGNDGSSGKDGSDGKSAYQSWLDQGNTGTEEEFVSSLKGDTGADGNDGVDGKDGLDGKPVPLGVEFLIANTSIVSNSFVYLKDSGSSNPSTETYYLKDNNTIVISPSYNGNYLQSEIDLEFTLCNTSTHIGLIQGVLLRYPNGLDNDPNLTMAFPIGIIPGSNDRDYVRKTIMIPGDLYDSLPTHTFTFAIKGYGTGSFIFDESRIFIKPITVFTSR